MYITIPYMDGLGTLTKWDVNRKINIKCRGHLAGFADAGTSFYPFGRPYVGSGCAPPSFSPAAVAGLA